jgi:hypothetical protein
MTRLQALKEKLRAAQAEKRIRQRAANISNRALRRVNISIYQLEAKIAYMEKS